MDRLQDFGRGGDVRVSRDELAKFRPPSATTTWFPVSHGAVLDAAVTRLGEAGYEVRKMDLGVSQDGHRFQSHIPAFVW